MRSIFREGVWLDRRTSARNAIPETATLIPDHDARSRRRSYEAAQSLASEYDRHKARLRPTTIEMIEMGLAITANEYDQARKVCHRARGGIYEVFADTDVILSPSAPGAAPLGLASTGTSTFNRLWTLMGTPCVNVPGLKDATGLPLGVQIIGPFGHDKETLEAALFVEAALARRS